ncbi:DotH/IcmK family type IV secretion protein [Cysteiniphilum sp. JM-1]|uniref:DotH/IcmK family type IV secretion protein n=1 Tax=Cysteiniphilum sp. JM-1 TaxID=2610891 RepID=UPI001244D69E|nr:DotH/IcmK family type IV secretion protein [Cysteiniphilum sp. JM-1]
MLNILITLLTIAMSVNVACAAKTAISSDSVPKNSADFTQALDKSFPLSSDEIAQIREKAEENEKATAVMPGQSSVASAPRILNIDLNPMAQTVPPVIRLGLGRISSVVMTDISGKNLKVLKYSLGDSAAFNVEYVEETKVIILQAKQAYQETNLLIIVEGVQTPIMLTLTSGQKVYDSIDYVRITRADDIQGMQAKPNFKTSSVLTQLLTGIAPQGAKRLTIDSEGSNRMWSWQGKYLLVTNGILLSPRWQDKSSVNNGDVTLNAYIFDQASSLVVSNNGHVESVKVQI